MNNNEENRKPEPNTDRTRKIVTICSVVFCIALIMIAAFFLSKPLINSINSPEGREEFNEWIHSYGFGGKLIVIAFMALQLILAVIPGGPVQLAAGVAYGVVEGTILMEFGIIIGASLVFFLVRKFGTKIVYSMVKREDVEKISFLSNEKQLTAVSFILMLIPGAPKDVLTYFLGLTKMKYPTFIIITVVGRLPALIMSTMTGDSVIEGNWQKVIVIVCVVCAVFVAGIIVYGWFIKKRKAKAEQNSEDSENH